MAYAYLVTDKATKKKMLVEASSPSVAVAHVAADAYTTQRVEGAVLESLADVLGQPVKASKRNDEKPDSVPAQEPANNQGAGKPPAKS